MYEQFKEILSNLPLTSTLFLSNFTPLELYEYAKQKGFTIKLLPSTLQGLIDTRTIKPFLPKDEATFILWPFFHHSSDIEILQTLKESHNFKLFTIKPQPLYAYENIQKVFKEMLDSSVDLDTGAITTDSHFIIYLRPHMFCPKEGIVDALKAKDVKFHTNLSALYKHEDFFSQRDLHTAAYESLLSFIALDCTISKEEAVQSSKVLLETLERESIRRCSF